MNTISHILTARGASYRCECGARFTDVDRARAHVDDPSANYSDDARPTDRRWHHMMLTTNTPEDFVVVDVRQKKIWCGNETDALRWEWSAPGEKYVDRLNDAWDQLSAVLDELDPEDEETDV